MLDDRPNQLDRRRDDVEVTADQLLDVTSADGGNTEQGLRNNLYVAVAYTAVWLSGNGAVAIHNLMEDAATAEISRSQVWQLIANQVQLADTGETVTPRAGGPAARRGDRPPPRRGRPHPVRAVLPAGEAAGRRPVPERGLRRLPHPARRTSRCCEHACSPGSAEDFLAATDAALADTDAFLQRAYPGEDGRRQPVHTVYVPG